MDFYWLKLQGYSYFQGKACKMIGKRDKSPQMNIFQVPLVQFINKEHELCQLAKQIDWQSVEDEFSSYYCPDNGRPSIPIRKIVGVLLLKMMFSHSDESVVERWQENPYWQHFCGEIFFQHEKPFDPTELVKFRKRIGEGGAEKLLKLSVNLFSRKEVEETEVCIDTTVQEKDITYPTDAKLRKKIIEKCWRIAEQEGIKLRQSYRRTLKQLMIDQRFREHPKRRKKANAAARKIDTIAGRVVRDIERKLTREQKQAYEKDLIIFNLVLQQKCSDKNKIYSLHEPSVSCIAKGKEAKKYEFGNKSSLVITKHSRIIVGAMAFEGNPYDGHTLDAQLGQLERLTGKLPRVAIVDRGYRGRKAIDETEICTPGKLKASNTPYQKQKVRKRFRSRAGIEPIIGHVKHDHRMERNFLAGVIGDQINTILAATGFNLMKKLRKIKKGLFVFIFNLKIWIENQIRYKRKIVLIRKPEVFQV